VFIGLLCNLSIISIRECIIEESYIINFKKEGWILLNKSDLENLYIPPLDKKVGKEVSAYLDTLTKPIGSLGRLEMLAIILAEMTRQRFPIVTPPAAIVFAADHGITVEGVSAFPKEVTGQMVLNFLEGGAAMNVFCRQIGASMSIVDVGVAEDITHDQLISRKVNQGTKNFLQEEAMTEAEVFKALTIGREEAATQIGNGAKTLIVGEVGIGNTTSASALLAAITGKPARELTGPGTGLTEEGLIHKQRIIDQAIERHQPNPHDPMDMFKKLGGFEITAMAGAMLEAAKNRIPIIVDGFICTVAAILATEIHEGASQYMIAGHQSKELGHQKALQQLGKEPILDLDMRLGEGTGAAVAFPIVQAATNMLREMATFAEAGVSEKD